MAPFSGASLDRPALQRLLNEVRAGRIDIIVVYKVDRLTRSLGDFAKLVELFDQYKVSFVSVTQSFNTTSSMGQLTLNVLLSFAQFEREVIGERVRDKIAASKKKGLWMGGPVPLGYRCIDKKLLIEPGEAETVRSIFRLYIKLGSMGALMKELDRRGIRTKVSKRANGEVRGGGRFGVGALAYLLKNRVYIGEVVYRKEVHRGEHEPILDLSLFEAVQAKLAANAVARDNRLKASPAILAGRIYDDRGNRMSPSHTNKRGVRYRYYVSQAVLQNQKSDAGQVVRVSAPDIETIVLKALRNHLRTANTGTGDSGSHNGRNNNKVPIPYDDRELIARHVHRVTVKPDVIEIRGMLTAPMTGQQDNGSQANQHRKHSTVGSGRKRPIPIQINVAWAAPTLVAHKGIEHNPSASPTMKPEARDALLRAVAKARQWINDLMEGQVASFKQIAASERKGERHIRSLAQLAFVSPRVVAAHCRRECSGRSNGNGTCKRPALCLG